MLFGRETSATKAEPPETSDAQMVVEYHMGASDELVAACVVELEFAALLGGALAMLSAEAVKEMVAEGDLGNSCRDALREVFNVCACLLPSTRDGSPSRLASVHERLEKAPEAVRELLEKGKTRTCFEVEVSGYATGLMAFTTP